MSEWDADCDRCGKPVCFDHDPPQRCGIALCDTCPGCECPECAAAWEHRMFVEGIYSELADPLHTGAPTPSYKPLVDFCARHNRRKQAVLIGGEHGDEIAWLCPSCEKE